MPWLALAGCLRAEVVDVCVEDPEACPPCASDADCTLGGNPCLDEVYCAHVDAPVAVMSIGCSKATERRWPPAEVCACRRGTCLSE